MASLRGKVIAISGAAGGMGAATAAVLASRGATLSLADVDIKVVDQVADELRAKFKADVFTSQVDVTKTVQVDLWIDATIKQFSKLTGAVNMAGILGKEFGIKSAHEVGDEEFDRVMAVNARGLMACQRAELRVLEDGGSIVNIASISAKVGFPKATSYAASKSAVLGLTRVAAAEAGERKIRVNAVAPGSIDTQMLQQANSSGSDVGTMTWPINRKGTAEEVGMLVAFLLGDESAFITGATYTIDGGMTF